DRIGSKTIFVTQLLRTKHSSEDNTIGECESFWQGILKNLAAHRVRARLKDGPQAPAWPAAARSLDCGLHRGRMVREIVDHKNAAVLALHVHTALDAAKCGKRSSQNIGSDTAAVSDGHRGESVQHVVLAGGCRSEVAKRLALVCDAESGRFALHAHI